MTAVIQLPGGGELDVATARREQYEFPGALPTVQPASLAADLWRRDFSINTMAVSLNGESFGQLHDPCGGYADLNQGLVRVLHDASFRDDPTRIIRAVGFEVKLGFRLEQHTASLLKQAVTEGVLGWISPERCREVLLPLLGPVLSEEIAARPPLPEGESPTRLRCRSSYIAQARQSRYGDGAGPGVRRPSNIAVPIIIRLSELGVLGALGLVEEVTDELQSALRQVPDALMALVADEQGTATALIYLVLLVHWAGAETSRVAAQIQLTSEEQKTMDKALRFIGQPPAVLSNPEIKPSQLYFALEGIDLVSAATGWTVAQNQLTRSRIEEFWHHVRTIRPDIDGDDLIAAGAQPGPRFAAALKEALRVKLDAPQATAGQQLAAALDYLAKSAEKS